MAAYTTWAIGYYGIELDLTLVDGVFAVLPQLMLDDLLEDLEEIRDTLLKVPVL